MTTPVEDPFAAPTPRSSDFAKADSFRGRLILVRPTKIERDVPKMSSQPNGAKGDKITANVTVVDGLGPVEAYDRMVPTGKMLDGPDYRGVWFNQDQIVEGLLDAKGVNLLPLVLMRIDTLNPGTRQGQGNPWVVTHPSEEDKQIARNFLANQTIGAASAPTAPAKQLPPAPPVYAAAPQQQPHPVGGPFAGAPASTGVTSGPPF